jgi:RsiW-degrading membrane proteinase PrsW (M82 family)
MDFLLSLVLLLSVAFLIPILYAIWIRNTERCHRQKWISIFICFFWGASLAIIAAFLLEFGLMTSLISSLQNAKEVSILMVIIIAPIVEEFAKPLILGTRAVRSQLTELEDGLIYGAVAGLGFSATENFFYGLDYLNQDLAAFLILIALRSFGACLLHASATALTGYGYGKKLLRKTSLLLVLPYYILAIFLHSFYNFIVSLDVTGIAIGLIIAFLFVGLTITLIRSKIQTLDQQNCDDTTP